MNVNGIKTVMNHGVKFLKDNTPVILTVMNTVGVVTTVVLAVKETPKAIKLIEECKPETTWDKIKLCAPCYVPAIMVGTATIACGIGATAASLRQNAVLVGLYSAAERSAKEYQQKVLKHLGEEGEKKIREEIVMDHMKNNPPTPYNTIYTEHGGELCYDKLSGRYFTSSSVALKRLENEINAKLLSENYISLNEVYSILGLPQIDLGDQVGWNVETRVKFWLSTMMTEDEKSCITVGYEEMPNYDYDTWY